MARVTRRALGIAALCGGFMLCNAGLSGQTAPPPAASSKGAVIGTGTFTAFVDNMDRSLAFFHDVFGMEVTVVSQGGGPVPIPPNLKGALVADLDNFFLTPFEPCDGCTSRPTAPAR